jgi:hypothetical protein
MPSSASLRTWALQGVACIDAVVGKVWREADEEGLELPDDAAILSELVPRFTEQLERKVLLDAFHRLTESMRAERYDFALGMGGPMDRRRHWCPGRRHRRRNGPED